MNPFLLATVVVGYKASLKDARTNIDLEDEADVRRGRRSGFGYCDEGCSPRGCLGSSDSDAWT